MIWGWFSEEEEEDTCEYHHWDEWEGKNNYEIERVWQGDHYHFLIMKLHTIRCKHDGCDAKKEKYAPVTRVVEGIELERIGMEIDPETRLK